LLHWQQRAAAGQFFFSRSSKQGIRRARTSMQPLCMGSWTTDEGASTWLPASRQTHGSGESKAAFCLLPLFHLLRVSAAASRPGQHCRPAVTVTAGKPRHRPDMKRYDPCSTSTWSKESRKQTLYSNYVLVRRPRSLAPRRRRIRYRANSRNPLSKKKDAKLNVELTFM